MQDTCVQVVNQHQLHQELLTLRHMQTVFLDHVLSVTIALLEQPMRYHAKLATTKTKQDRHFANLVHLASIVQSRDLPSLKATVLLASTASVPLFTINHMTTKQEEFALSVISVSVV